MLIVNVFCSPDDNVFCSPDDGDFCWCDLDLWLDAMSAQSDILTTQERSDTTDLFTTFASTYIEDPTPTKVTQQRIIIDVAKIALLQARLAANKGRLWGMLSS